MTTEKEWWGADVVPRIQWVLHLPRKRIVEGGMAPDGYGVAWREAGRDGVVCMPVPINLIARALRELWYAIKYPMWGKADGWGMAVEIGRRESRREITLLQFDVKRLYAELRAANQRTLMFHDPE